ncbi:MAG: c-type cytochrome, partial [Flavobacteriales bacterium]
MILLNKLKNRLLFLTVFCTISLQTFSQINGEDIFKSNGCNGCHSLGTNKLTGPGVEGITDRRSTEWLKSWITDNAAFRKSGDKDAIALYEEYNQEPMASFYMPDEEMDALLLFLADPPVEEVSVSKSIDSLSSEEEGMSNNTQLVIFLILLFVVITVLVSEKNSLKESLSQDTETVHESILRFVSKNRNKFI